MNIVEIIQNLKNLNAESFSPALLKSLHLVTREGKINQDAARKLKQVFHLFQHISPMLQEIFEKHQNPKLVDLGSGKAYLAFLLHEAVLAPLKRGEMTGVESRPDLIARCQELTKAKSTSTLHFQQSHIEDFKAQDFHFITALHACDTATDDAIHLALKFEVPYLALVPCCQAEISRQFDELKKGPLFPLWRLGTFSREFGSHLTNVYRALLLEAHGYKVTVTEFTGWEHSLKNQLILARKHQRSNGLAIRQLKDLYNQIPVFPSHLKDDFSLLDSLK